MNAGFAWDLSGRLVRFRLILLTQHELFYLLNNVLIGKRRMRSAAACLVAGQLYPSGGFSSTVCGHFLVSNPCRGIHSTLATAFVHHAPLTDKIICYQNRTILGEFHHFIYYFLLTCKQSFVYNKSYCCSFLNRKFNNKSVNYYGYNFACTVS